MLLVEGEVELVDGVGFVIGIHIARVVWVGIMYQGEGCSCYFTVVLGAQPHPNKYGIPFKIIAINGMNIIE